MGVVGTSYLQPSRAAWQPTRCSSLLSLPWNPDEKRRIDGLYRSRTGLKELPDDPIVAKRAILRRRAERAGDVLRTILDATDLHDEFVLRLTYTSNQIEGSALTEQETAVVLFQNATLPYKTLTEQLEAKNHQAALVHLFAHLASRRGISEQLVLKLHAILMNGIRDDAGIYRRHAVRIVGSNVPTANYVKVPRHSSTGENDNAVGQSPGPGNKPT